MQYVESKKIDLENGGKKIATIHIRLNDECKNGVCDFGVTHKLFIKGKNGKNIIEEIGASNEDFIKEYFPNYMDFYKLHMCNRLGQPLYPIENGMYHLSKSSAETAIDYLRITKDEYFELVKAEKYKSKEYFAYMLYKLGIVDRWKEEAAEAIKRLEELTGTKFVNPYKEEEEKFVLQYPKDIDLREYTDKPYSEWVSEKEKESFDEHFAEIIKKIGEKKKNLEIEKEVRISLLKAFPLFYTNILLIPESKLIIIGWKSYEDMPTEDEYNTYISTKEAKELIDKGWKINYNYKE